MDHRQMRVLFLESTPRTGFLAEEMLREAGHEIRRCHDHGDAVFPCNGLSQDSDRSCPMDEPGGVDVAVAFRGRPFPTPTRQEDGAICAIRRDIPLVVAGDLTSNPFAPWSTSVERLSELPIAVDDVVKQSRPRLSAIATAAVGTALEAFGLPDCVGHAEVHGRGDDFSLVVHLPEEARDIGPAAAVRVLDALHRAAPSARTIDVAIRTEPTRPDPPTATVT